MSKIKASSVEGIFVKDWKGWDGDGLSWTYFYDVTLNADILKDCVAKGWSETDSFDLEMSIDQMNATVFVNVEGSDPIEVMKYSLALTVVGKE